MPGIREISDALRDDFLIELGLGEMIDTHHREIVSRGKLACRKLALLVGVQMQQR